MGGEGAGAGGGGGGGGVGGGGGGGEAVDGYRPVHVDGRSAAGAM